MRLDLAQVRRLFMHELRSLLRDRKTLVLAVLLPLAIMPIMLLASRYAEESSRKREQSRTYTYAVTGSEAARARELIAHGLSVRAEQAARDTAASEGDGASWTLEEVETEDPEAALEDEGIDFYVVGLSSDEAAVLDSIEAAAADAENEAQAAPDEDGAGEAGAADSLAAAAGPPVPTPVFQVFFRGNQHASRNGADRFDQVLTAARDDARETLLTEHAHAVRFEDVLPVESESVAETGQVAGAMLGRFLTMIVVFLIIAGGISVSTDLVAGEKERGTLETLLTTAISRAEIVTAKGLLVTSVAITITLINLANVLVYVGFGIIPLPEGLAATLSPTSMIMLVALLLPVAVLVAGILLLVSTFAKSYKEAQTYFFPVQLLMILPPAAAFLPGLELRSIVSVVPIANISVAVREVLVGTYDWPMLALAWLVTAASAVWVIRLSGKLLSSEEFIIAGGVRDSSLLTGTARLARQLPVWLLVAWGLFLIVNLNYPATTDIRVQLFVNLILIFLGITVAMLRVYKLPFAKTLRLTAPRPIVWLAVLIGAPTSFVAASAAGRVAAQFLPVPERVLEAFSQAILPDHIPFWQLAILLSVLPGFCEEMLFRGAFIHAWKRRFHPVTLALLSGLVFGLFHVDLFRIVPTATLGVIMAAVVLLTGSLWPAIAWHAINNGTLVVLGKLGKDPSTFGVTEWSIATALFVASMALLWFTRRVYPGLKTEQSAPAPAAATSDAARA